jgi:hypothetical protein
MPLYRAPRIGPGEIWLIEQPPQTSISPLARDALTDANVVIYDRSLAPLVANILPIGAYAEPSSPDVQLPDVQLAGAMLSPRALEFAAEGWSVVQLAATRSGWRRWQPTTAALLARLSGNPDLPVLAIAKTATGRYRETDAGLLDLSELIDSAGADDLLTLVFGPIGMPRQAPVQAFTANGLAG